MHFFYCRNSLERSLSVKHVRDNSTHLSSSNSGYTSSLELSSLSFHDHHLGKKDRPKLVKSTTLDERKASCPIIPKPHQLPSFENRRVSDKRKSSVQAYVLSPNRVEKWKPGSAAMNWLSRQEVHPVAAHAQQSSVEHGHGSCSMVGMDRETTIAKNQ